MRTGFVILAIAAAPLLDAQTVGRVEPGIQRIVSEISRDCIAAIMQMLASCETQGDFSNPN